MKERTHDEVAALRERLEAAFESGTLAEIERAVIELRAARLGSATKVAESLGLAKPTVFRRFHEYGLRPPR